MKPFYKSKKFWTAVITSVAMTVAYFRQDKELAALITTIGGLLIVGFGLEDHGKAAKAIGSKDDETD